MASGYENIFQSHLDALAAKGTSKSAENSITGFKHAEAGNGPRCFLAGQGDKPYLLMNSNSYLELSRHPEVIAAEEEAVRALGSGPGAVRFISGTFQTHVKLEELLAAFHGRQACMLFSSAYASVMGVLPQLISKETVVISDELNHNCIINAIRLAHPATKEIYTHLDMVDLEKKIQKSVGLARRVVLVTDGIFSMRGDHAPLNKIKSIVLQYRDKFAEGIITVVDDSHGVGVFGKSGRGTEEYTGSDVDVLIATLGKALGVNGGYVAASRLLINYLRETAPFYIYSNPITQAEAAAALRSLHILDSPAGKKLLERLRHLTRFFEKGLQEDGYEILSSEHPIVPLMIRDTAKTKAIVRFLFTNGVLATGLTFPVVPQGDEEVRFQISSSHTENDLKYVLSLLRSCRRSFG